MLLNDNDIVSTFAGFWGIGVVYTLIFPLMGTSFLYFMPLLSTVQSVVGGLIYALVAIALMHVVNDRRLQAGLLTLPLIVYTGGWQYIFKGLTFSAWGLFVWALLITGVLVVAGGLLYFALISTRRRWTMAGAGLLVLAGQFIALSVIPAHFLTGYVSSYNLYVISKEAPEGISNSKINTSQYVYPLTMPMGQGYERYGWLLPDIESKKGNVVLVLDAMRRGYIGKKLNNLEATPNLSDIRKDGRLFNRYYTQSSWTKASTASLFTGQYARQHGVCFAGNSYSQKLPDSNKTLAERLNDKGVYNSAHVFITHITDKYNFDQGFDRFTTTSEAEGQLAGLEQTFFELARKDPDEFFLYIHLKGPHAPYSEGVKNAPFWKHGTGFYKGGMIRFPQNWNLPRPGKLTSITIEQATTGRTPIEIRMLRYIYLAQLNFYDRVHVGATKRLLKGMDVYDKTFLNVTGDHGEEIYHNAEKTDKGIEGRFGHKRILSESVINPPLLVKPPAGSERPQIDGVPIIETVDLTATLLDRAQAPSDGVEGKSFLNLLNEGGHPEGFEYALAEECSSHKPQDLVSLRHNEILSRTKIKRAAVVDRDWKLIHEYRDASSTLYRIRNGEQENVQGGLKVVGRLENTLYNTLGGNPVLKSPSFDFKKTTAAETRKLKGLGYIE